MSLDELLGHRVRMKIRRINPTGAYVSANDRDDVLVLGAELAIDAAVGDELDVFVYLDSEGRPLATTKHAKLELGQVAFLEVTQCTRVGAFVDWGLPKELLVPFAEQTSELRPGMCEPIGVTRDRTGRFVGTMRVSEMLGRAKRRFTEDEWVEGEAWRYDPQIGLFAIVDKAFVGLLPRDEPHRLSRGERARFRVTNVLPDGKIELSQRRHAHEELEADAAHILEVLSRPNAPKLGDKSSPDEIRAVFGLSKKAFKRAVGRLLKEGTATIDREGFVVRA